MARRPGSILASAEAIARSIALGDAGGAAYAVDAATARVNGGLLLLQMGRAAEAERFCGEAVHFFASRTEASPVLRNTRLCHGQALMEVGSFAEAEMTLSAAQKAFEAAEAGPAVRALVEIQLSRSIWERGDRKHARARAGRDGRAEQQHGHQGPAAREGIAPGPGRHTRNPGA